jgi:predicted dehydrogenase
MHPKLRILVVGCGHMGVSHARAYHTMADDFTIVGLVSRGPLSREKLNVEFGSR